MSGSGDHGALFGISLQEVVDQLREAGCVFAEDEAGLLAEAAADRVELNALIVRRIGGEPLEYILGWAEFCGLRVRVGPGVFVPRRRTAFLVALGASLVAGRGHPVVVDVCCGSGAIAAALATRVPEAELYATDIDAAAVACARENLAGAGAVMLGDLFSALPAGLRGRVDLLVANAPYVPTAAIETMPREARLHEARATLDGGQDGLDLHRRIAAEASDWLRASGSLLLETSDVQAARTADLVSRAGFTAVIERSERFDATVVTGTLS
ncbi:release factor glutamine methyltransferase [Mycetocola sp. CAN_C7]